MSEVTRFYYKVVTKDLKSCIAHTSPYLCVQYKAGEWVYARKNTPGLMIFGDHLTAGWWFRRQTQWDRNDYEIWACERGEILPDAQEILSGFVLGWITNKDEYDWRVRTRVTFARTPEGTRFTDKVKLIRKVVI